MILYCIQQVRNFVGVLEILKVDLELMNLNSMHEIVGEELNYVNRNIDADLVLES